MNERPRWSPDSKRIAFISNRGGSSQIWIMNADGTGVTAHGADLVQAKGIMGTGVKIGVLSNGVTTLASEQAAAAITAAAAIASSCVFMGAFPRRALM